MRPALGAEILASTAPTFTSFFTSSFLSSTFLLFLAPEITILPEQVNHLWPGLPQRRQSSFSARDLRKVSGMPFSHSSRSLHSGFSLLSAVAVFSVAFSRRRAFEELEAFHDDGASTDEVEGLVASFFRC